MTDTPSRPRKRFTVDALFSDTRPQAVGVSDLAEAKLIDLDRIQPDPAQPRRTFDPDRLDELTQSIRSEGVLQPIVVRFDAGDDRYVIVHGERRWRASKSAGLERIPAIVRDVPQERRLVQQLMENVVRDDLNAVDRAAALRALRGQLGDPSWEVVADTVGIKRSRLFQLLGTGKLHDQAQDDIRAGRLSEKQSRALQGLPEVKQDALRELILAEQMPAAAAMRLARAYKDAEIAPPNDPVAARRALDSVKAFVFATGDDQVRAQTSVLLDAIRLAAGGGKPERTNLRTLASTLDAQRYREERLGQDLNALAKTLAALPASGAEPTEQARESLRQLRDALDALLS